MARYRRPVSPAARARRDAARQEKLTALHASLAEQVHQLQTTDGWRDWLAVAARFHGYSFNNTLLIWAARPDAGPVAGYRAWQALGRQVRKGETGIQILAPITKRTAEAGAGDEPDAADEGAQVEAAAGADTAPAATRRVVGWRPAYVWGIEQTDGDPLPDKPPAVLLAGHAPDGLWDRLAAVAEQAGYILTRGDCPGPANGITDFAARTITVRADVADAQAVKTLCHELGHTLLHDPTDPAQTSAGCRGTAEVEAESVAYLVAAAHGLDTGEYTFPYITGWAASAGDIDQILADTGRRVLAAAGQLVDATTDRPTATPALAASATAGAGRTARLREDAEHTLRSLDEPPADLARLHAAVAAAVDFYRDQLHQLPADRGPRAYLTARAGGPAAVQAWQAGYAPAGWTGLCDHLRAAGYTEEELMSAGLGLRTRRGTVVDRFRDRLMLPAHDGTGRPVGFVGRAAPGAGPDVPRYLNSPESVLYHKADLLLGLQPARGALEHGAVPVVVEGAFDAMAVTGCGDGHYVGVAPSGTALTPSQVRALDRTVRLAERGVVVAFDGDPAGRHAAAAAFPTLAVTGAWPGHATLPDGSDPASLAGEGLRDALDRAGEQPLAHLAVGQAVWPHRDILDTPGGREDAVRNIARTLAPATALERVEALLPSVAALANTDVDIVRTVLDRQRHGSGARGRYAAPDRREDLDRGQCTVTVSPAERARAAYPIGLPAELPATSVVAGRGRQPTHSASRPHR